MIDERLALLHKRARGVEDYGMYVGLAIAALYGLSEAVVYTATSLGLVPEPGETRVPWITVILFVGCVLPKTIGRVTTGKVWVTLATGVASWFSRQPPPKPPGGP